MDAGASYHSWTLFNNLRSKRSIHYGQDNFHGTLTRPRVQGCKEYFECHERWTLLLS